MQIQMGSKPSRTRYIIIAGLRFIGASVLAFSLLNAFCFFYYNPPIHIISDTGSTDYVYEASNFYSSATEGYASGYIDKNGFSNLDINIQNNPTVLIMGSSHIEAHNVNQRDSAVSILNDLFSIDKRDISAYSIATSGHDLYKNIANLERAVNEFSPQKCVIIETSSVRLSKSNMHDSITDGLGKIPSYDSGIIHTLQKFPFFRLMYSQVESWNSERTENKTVAKRSEGINEDYKLLLNQMMMYVNGVSKRSGVKIAILYQPSLILQTDGSTIPDTDEDYLKAFKDSCYNNNIDFIDMTNSFVQNYTDKHILPHGFSNTEVGKGHLNRYGHRLIAQEIYAYVSENIEKEIKQ